MVRVVLPVPTDVGGCVQFGLATLLRLGTTPLYTFNLFILNSIVKMHGVKLLISFS